MAMPLINVSSGAIIKRVPYASEFAAFRRALTKPEFNSVIARINELIDEAGAEIATAGWLPGADWTGTPFEPIYTKGAKMNQSLAGRFFGLSVWFAIMQRPEQWASGRYQLNGQDIGSRTYFRIGK